MIELPLGSVGDWVYCAVLANVFIWCFGIVALVEFGMVYVVRDHVDRIAREFYPLRREYADKVGVDLSELGGLTPVEEEFIDDLEGFEFIDWGIARVIISPVGESGSSGDVIYKLARSAESEMIYDGREQNEYESFLSSAVRERFDGDSRPKLLPVLESDSENYWLKMPRVEIVSRLDLSDELVRDIRDDILRSLRPVIDNVMLGELSSDNLGRYDGEYYLVDYGGDPMVAGSL